MPVVGDPSWEFEKAAAIGRLEDLRGRLRDLEELTAETREAYEEAIRVAEPYIRLGGVDDGDDDGFARVATDPRGRAPLGAFR